MALICKKKVSLKSENMPQIRKGKQVEYVLQGVNLFKLRMSICPLMSFHYSRNSIFNKLIL